MSKSSLRNCSTCKPNDEGQTDCAVCKLAFLADSAKAKKEREAEKKLSIDEDDDYSISERLTDNKGDNTILILFIVGLLTFAATVGFVYLLK